MCNSSMESVFDWRELWFGMPEYIADDLSAARTVKIHFRNDRDVQRFAELIQQQITPKQKSLWFPEMPKRKTAHLRYLEIDEISEKGEKKKN